MVTTTSEMTRSRGVPTDDEELARYLLELLRREKAGERARIEVGPYTAMLLVGAIQWAVQHGLPEHGPEMFQKVLDQLKLMFADDPAGAALIELYERRPDSDKT